MENSKISLDNENTNNIETEEFVSPLWKKDYWDTFYSQEINQFKNNTDLIGEIWFGKQVHKKILSYINENYGSDKNFKILDVGCGNAAFLLKLSKLGYSNLYGMDYSEKSIELAQEIINEKSKKNENMKNIILFQDDIKNGKKLDSSDFDLIHDKGTFDAFMSSKENKSEEYIQYILNYCKISNDIKNSSILIITSCNFSKPELIKFFDNKEGDKNIFTFANEIPHKSFTFGGQSGQPVTTLIYRINKI
jgi:SAM-dependent methyltransferase